MYDTLPTPTLETASPLRATVQEGWVSISYVSVERWLKQAVHAEWLYQRHNLAYEFNELRPTKGAASVRTASGPEGPW
jgi:hypothetical protein